MKKMSTFKVCMKIHTNMIDSFACIVFYKIINFMK